MQCSRFSIRRQNNYSVTSYFAFAHRAYQKHLDQRTNKLIMFIIPVLHPIHKSLIILVSLKDRSKNTIVVILKLLNTPHEKLNLSQ